MTAFPDIDSNLLQQLAAGDEKAFEQLFHQTKNRVYEIALLYTESTVLAEEITQDVFVQIWVKQASLSEIKDFSSWLFTLTRNRSFNVLRGIARQETLQRNFISHLPSESGREYQDRLLMKEIQQLISEALELLSPPQRKAFELFKLQGLSRDEVAKEMNISPNTVKVHLLYGMRIIRAYLVRRNIVLPGLMVLLSF